MIQTGPLTAIEASEIQRNARIAGDALRDAAARLRGRDIDDQKVDIRAIFADVLTDASAIDEMTKVTRENGAGFAGNLPNGALAATPAKSHRPTPAVQPPPSNIVTSKAPPGFFRRCCLTSPARNPTQNPGSPR